MKIKGIIALVILVTSHTIWAQFTPCIAYVGNPNGFKITLALRDNSHRSISSANKILLNLQRAFEEDAPISCHAFQGGKWKPSKLKKATLLSQGEIELSYKRDDPFSHQERWHGEKDALTLELKKCWHDLTTDREEGNGHFYQFLNQNGWLNFTVDHKVTSNCK